MNATQIGNLIKSGLLALGVSSSVLGYVSAEVWVAVGGAILAIGTVIWQIIASKTATLIATVADEPEVVKVVVDDEPLADSIPSRKVVAK